MLALSFFLIILGISLHKSNAVDLQKLCQGQRYGTLLPNPNDCNSFYVCQFVVQLTKCDIGLHFDRKNKVCNWPQFADCDWVDPESSSSEDKVPDVKPEKPNTNADNEQPAGPAVEQPLPADVGKPNEVEESKPSEEGNVIQPPVEDAHTSKESEESKLDSAVTENDFITTEPPHPAVDPSISSEENHDHEHNLPSTDGDMIIDGIQTPSPSSAENHDNQPNFPPTIDDMITQTPSVNSEESVEPTPGIPPTPPISEEETDQQPSEGNQESSEKQPSAEGDKPENSKPPIMNSAESSESVPGLPEPIHPERPPPPPINEGTDQQSSEGNQDSSEKQPEIEGEKPENPKPPNIDENVNETDAEGSSDLPTAGDHSSHHWNLIASIVSVESSHVDGFINNPTVGAHSPETGYPIDAMTGYNPNNVQCLHSGLYFLPHPSNCQKYYICAYRHLHLHSCGGGVIWNHKREQCDLKGNARCYSRDAESENSTELPTPFIDNQTKTTTRKTTRPPTRRPTTKTPTTISHKLPICPATRQVYLPNLDDCHKYFICIMGKPVLTSCPSAMHWDAVGEFCGKPSAVRCARH